MVGGVGTGRRTCPARPASETLAATKEGDGVRGSGEALGRIVYMAAGRVGGVSR